MRRVLMVVAGLCLALAASPALAAGPPDRGNKATVYTNECATFGTIQQSNCSFTTDIIVSAPIVLIGDETGIPTGAVLITTDPCSGFEQATVFDDVGAGLMEAAVFDPKGGNLTWAMMDRAALFDQGAALDANRCSNVLDDETPILNSFAGARKVAYPIRA